MKPKVIAALKLIYAKAAGASEEDMLKALNAATKGEQGERAAGQVG